MMVQYHCTSMSSGFIIPSIFGLALSDANLNCSDILKFFTRDALPSQEKNKHFQIRQSKSSSLHRFSGSIPNKVC